MPIPKFYRDSKRDRWVMAKDQGKVSFTFNDDGIITDGSGNIIGDASVPTLYKLDDLTAPNDNLDLNASTTVHGLLPKLNNLPASFFSGIGTWSSLFGSIGLAPKVVAANNATTYEKMLANLTGGTICDGVSDENEINAGLTSIGDTVQLTSGSYCLTGKIAFTANNQVLNLGAAIITSGTNVDLIGANAFVNGETIKRCIVKGGILDGRNLLDRGLRGSHLSRIKFEDTEFRNFRKWAAHMYCTLGNTAEFRNCFFHDNGKQDGFASYAGGLKIGAEWGAAGAEDNLSYPNVIVDGGSFEWNKDGIWIVAGNSVKIRTMNEGNDRHGIIVDVKGAGYENRNISIETHFESNNGGTFTDGDDVHIVSGGPLQRYGVNLYNCQFSTGVKFPVSVATLYSENVALTIEKCSPDVLASLSLANCAFKYEDVYNNKFIFGSLPVGTPSAVGQFWQNSGDIRTR